jgi:hypothetical protein
MRSLQRPSPELNRFILSEARNGAANIDHIYMDAMGFGMGCCCLQVTFQSCNVNEARRMYDAMVPLAPIMVSKRQHWLNFSLILCSSWH